MKMNIPSISKPILILSIFLYGNFSSQAQNRIEVEVKNFKSNEGVAMIGLFNNEGNFLNNEYKGKKVEIKNNKAIAVFENIPDGTYAISVFHDENENGKLDKFLGIPKEDYGTSNNAPSSFGPPKWKDAKFEVQNGVTVKQQISL